MSFTVDALAAEVDPAPCVSVDCHATSQTLYDATIVPGAAVTLDLAGIADEEEDDWVSDAYLNVTLDGAADGPVSVFAGDRELPNLSTLQAVGAGHTVRISPSLQDEIVISNDGTVPLELNVVLGAWVSGYTANLRQFDEDVDLDADQMIDEMHMTPAFGLDPVVAPLSPPPPPDCNEESSGVVNCIGQKSFAVDDGFEARADLTNSSNRMQARATSAQTLPGSYRDDDCYDDPDHWVYVNRGRACRISILSYYLLEPDKTGDKETGSINYLLFEQLDFRINGVARRTSRAYWISSSGKLSGQTLTLSHNITCVGLCNENRITTTDSEHISPYDRWSGYMISDARVSLSPGAVVEGTSEDIYSSIRGTAGGYAVRTYAPSGPPSFRCDRRSEVKVFDRHTGCVFDSVIPVFELDPVAYPQHSALVGRGQASLWLHPGAPYYDGEETRPLTRIAAKGTGNRRVAQRLCKAKNFKQSCDEYPYNSTDQGCKTGVNVDGYPTPYTPACVVRDVPLSENKRAGSWLLAHLRSNRVLYGDDYWITADGHEGPIVPT